MKFFAVLLVVFSILLAVVFAEPEYSGEDPSPFEYFPEKRSWLRENNRPVGRQWLLGPIRSSMRASQKKFGYDREIMKAFLFCFVVFLLVATVDAWNLMDLQEYYGYPIQPVDNPLKRHFGMGFLNRGKAKQYGAAE